MFLGNKWYATPDTVLPTHDLLLPILMWFWSFLIVIWLSDDIKQISSECSLFWRADNSSSRPNSRYLNDFEELRSLGECRASAWYCSVYYVRMYQSFTTFLDNLDVGYTPITVFCTMKWGSTTWRYFLKSFKHDLDQKGRNSWEGLALTESLSSWLQVLNLLNVSH